MEIKRLIVGAGFEHPEETLELVEAMTPDELQLLVTQLLHLIGELLEACDANRGQ